jgi:oligo-1,6-glucosidase
MHLFAIDQPDLNWDNPDVRAAVFDMMKFWLDRGIHGFRVLTATSFTYSPTANHIKQMDVINHISKVHGLPDAAISNPNSVTQQAGAMYSNGYVQRRCH